MHLLDARASLTELGLALGIDIEEPTKLNYRLAPFYEVYAKCGRLNVTYVKATGADECDEENVCTGGLLHFQKGKSDFMMLPVPLDVFTPFTNNFAMPGPALQLQPHVMGHIINRTSSTSQVKDLLQSVSIDIYSGLLFFTYFLVSYLLSTFIRKKLKDHKMDAGYYQKMVRVILNQPNFNPKTFAVRLVFINFLLAIFLLSTIYRNMFKTDLMVKEPLPLIDSYEDFIASNRYVIYGLANAAYSIIKKCDSTMCHEFQHRIDKKRMSFADQSKEAIPIAEELVARAVALLPEYMHGYFERYHCANDDYTNTTSRYHRSKEKFFPRNYLAAYAKNISKELRERLDFLFRRFLEAGLPDQIAKLKPTVVKTDDTQHRCGQSKLTDDDGHADTINPVLFKNVEKSLIVAGCLLAWSTVYIISELTLPKLFKLRRRRKLRKSRARATVQSYVPVSQSLTVARRMSTFERQQHQDRFNYLLIFDYREGVEMTIY